MHQRALWRHAGDLVRRLFPAATDCRPRGAVVLANDLLVSPVMDAAPQARGRPLPLYSFRFFFVVSDGRRNGLDFCFAVVDGSETESRGGKVFTIEDLNVLFLSLCSATVGKASP